MNGRNPRRVMRGRVGRLVVVAVAGSVLLSACAGGGSSSSSSSKTSASAPTSVTNGIVGVQNDEGSPVKGGTLSFAGYSVATSLDPTKTQPSGATGGTEMSAIYDVLVRYDASTNKFSPQLAQSLDADSAQKVWTLKLRPGVTFSDGTAVDSQAVVASIERFNKNRGANAQVWQAAVSKMEATDPATVVITLNQPWREFPTMLASGQGMIVAPAAYKTPTFTPIGAGPFTLQTFAPNEGTVVKARPDYWGGAPNLDSLKFVALLGDKAKADSLKSGGVQMAFTRTPQVVAQEQAAGYPGFLLTQPLGGVFNLNNRPGHPGSDVRVRQAIAYATNVDTVNQRVYENKGLPGTEIFPVWSQWHNDVGGLKFDQAKAKQLLDAAKKDGASTTIRYIGLSDPAAQQTALTAQALLQAAGFTVNIEYQNSVADVVKKLYVDHDYDMAFASYSLYNVDPYTRLYSALNSKSTNNTVGYNNPDMDALLAKVQAATTDEAKKAVLADLQKLVNDTVPFVTVGATATFIPWQKNVHGVKPTLDGVILFDKVWLK